MKNVILIAVICTCAFAYSQQIQQNQDSINQKQQLYFSNIFGEDENLERVGNQFLYNGNYFPKLGDVYVLMLKFNTIKNMESIRIPVLDNYSINIQNIGEISTKNKSYKQLRSEVLALAKAKLKNLFYIDFFLSTPSKINIFLVGNVNYSGYKSITSTQRISEVFEMFSMPNSSTRNIKVIRDGQEIVYDLFKYRKLGDRTQNQFLFENDKVVLGKVENEVLVEGQILDPGIKEIKPGDTLKDILELSNGFLENSDKENIKIKRREDGGSKEYIINLNDSQNFQLQSGDSIEVQTLKKQTDFIIAKDYILVEGAFRGRADYNKIDLEQNDKPSLIKDNGAPLKVEIVYRPSLTLLDVLELLNGPSFFADYSKARIIRRSGQIIYTPQINKLWLEKDSKFDVKIMPGDRILLPEKSSYVIVTGAVGSTQGDQKYFTVKWYDSMTVEDAIKQSGGIYIPTGSAQNLQVVDPLGRLKKVYPWDVLESGSVLFVGKNAWENSKYVLDEIKFVVGWITTIFAFITTSIDLYVKIKNIAKP